MAASENVEEGSIKPIKLKKMNKIVHLVFGESSISLCQFLLRNFYQHKLCTANSGDEIGRPFVIAMCVGKSSDHAITHIATKGIINMFEVINIAHR